LPARRGASQYAASVSGRNANRKKVEAKTNAMHSHDDRDRQRLLRARCAAEFIALREREGSP
jgi:hypothetical protein